MAGNSSRRGAVRKSSSKGRKGPNKGSGGEVPLYKEPAFPKGVRTASIRTTDIPARLLAGNLFSQ